LNDDVERIEDVTELAQVRRQARRVQIKAFLAAILLTLIALVLPQWPWRKARSSAVPSFGRIGSAMETDSMF
jgi:hypothetical protein